MVLKLTIISLMALACLCGCKKRDGGVNIPARTNAPQRQPINQVILGGREIQFPPTRIVLTDREPLTIQLITRVSAGETGNELNLTLLPQVNALYELYDVEYDIKALDAEWTDSLEGFILDNGKLTLQPYDVRALIFYRDNWIRIELVGDFLAFDEGSDTPRAEKVKAMGLWEGVLSTRD
jgi:hypothetical protein